MRRITLKPRDHWQALVEGRGFDFHTPRHPRTQRPEAYWVEDAMYVLTQREVDTFYDATLMLNDLCYRVVEAVLGDDDLLRRFRIPPSWWAAVRASWRRGDKPFYGRMDFTLVGDTPKLLEFNADTPTTLYESAVAQWDRFEASPFKAQGMNQFASTHEDMIRAWADPRRGLQGKTVHFACLKNCPEDRGTVDYLQDLAIQGGLKTAFVHVEDIDITVDGRHLLDAGDGIIEVLFKLYPWEMMATDEFGREIPALECVFIEPLWKIILSNKALLPTLWRLFPHCEYLLPAYFDDDGDSSLTDYVRKPIFGREGANITVVTPQGRVASGGDYGQEGFIRQQYAPLPQFATARGPVSTMVGVWLVGGVHDDPDEPKRNGRDKPTGLTLREDDGPITSDFARFVPHYFEPA